MRAVVCKELRGPDHLVVEELPDPEAVAGQVVIEVKAAGVNFPDVLITQGKYQFKPDVPFSPGGEAAGVVVEVGAGVESVSVGDPVLATLLWGGYAEKVVVEAERLVRIPDGVGFETAAAFLQTYGTSLYALADRGGLREGETLAVLGASGGVGLAAVEIGKLLGARVIACASSDDKLAVCREHGADELVNYQREDLKERLKALSGGQGVDVIVDPVGGPYSEPALRAIAWGGRHLVIGFAAGDIPKIPLNLTLLKSCQIVGVFWGVHTLRERDRHLANVARLTEWLTEGKIRPHVSRSYPFDRVREALHDVMERRAVGKIVLVP
jgi:NADPH2:quinone reductase